MKTTKDLFQWDINQKLIEVEGIYVDFLIGDEIYRVASSGGECLIPDEWLQTGCRKVIWECFDDNTRRAYRVNITERPQPPDYVYTPTERETFDTLVAKVEATIDDLYARVERGDFNGKDGEDGKDYAITEEDYEAIARKVEEDIDISSKADKSYVDQQDNLLGGAITNVATSLTNSISSVASDLSAKIDDKADADDVYTKEAIDGLIGGKADVGTVEALNTNLRTEINKKQNKLTAGTNVEIVDDTISFTGGGGEGDVTKEYLEANYYDKTTINQVDSLVESDDPVEYSFVEEADISYSNFPLYCGTWVDGKSINRRVYVVTSGIAKDNTIKVADKPSNMNLLIRGWGIVEGTASATKHTMTNSDITVYVNDDGVYAVNKFTGYAERLYVILEYTVNEV